MFFRYNRPKVIRYFWYFTLSGRYYFLQIELSKNS